MKGKKVLALLTSTLMCVSMLAGCGGSSAKSSVPAESTSAAVSSAEESTAPAEEVQHSTDPLEMITQGYYSWTYPVDGMDDMCAFFHFYEEQPVLGSVFYAGFAWNQITYVGTYTVEEKETAYKCSATREDQAADPVVMTEGTAPYCVTFYDFEGNELGACAFDGEILYNDSAVSGIGGENCMYSHDVDEQSPYMATYEGEVGIAYLDFVAEDPTSTLTLYHNGRYMDLVDMMVEGTWTMAQGADGYEYTLTPDYDSDTGAVVVVSADESACVYTADGAEEGIPMTNTKSSGPVAQLEMKGTTPIPGQEINADVIGKLYSDGTVTLVASAFGTDLDLDNGTWSMGEDGYTITFQFTNAGELVSGLGEAGAVLQYQVSSEMLGEIDTELVISFAENAAAVPAYVMTGQIPVTEEAMADVSGTLYDDGTVTLTASAFGQSLDLDMGTYTVENYVFTFQFDTAGELVSGFGDAGAVLQYKAVNEVLGEIDTELVIAMPE